MTLFEYINTNKDKIEEMISLGLLKYKANFHYSIYSRYLYYTKFHNKTQSIEKSCRDHNTCRVTGFTAIKEMEKKLK